MDQAGSSAPAELRDGREEADGSFDAFWDVPPSGGAPSSAATIVTRAITWIRAHVIDVVLVAVLTLLVLPDALQPPTTGLDPGYMAGLNLAITQDVRFGHDWVFTYGPLGFLNFPILYLPRTWLLTVLVTFVTQVALVALTYALVRRVAPRWASFAVLAVGLPPLLPPSIVLTSIALLWALIGALRDRPFPRSWVLGAGAYIAFVAVIKADSAAMCAAVLGVATVAKALEVGRPRAALGQALELGAATAAGTVALWLITGQRLSDLFGWARGSIGLTRGYATAMGYEDPARVGDYAVAAIFVAWIVIGTAVARSVPVRRRVVLGAVLGVALAIGFRQGFVRHDMHVFNFYLPIVFMAAGVAPVWGRARAAALAAAALIAISLVSGIRLTERLDVPARVRDAMDVAHLTVDSAARAEQVAANRDRLREQYAIPPELLARMEGQTVHISPYETAVAYAYPELVWSPLPVLQDYAAYTPALDQLNVDRLASDERPRFILRQPGLAIDGRLARWEGPEAAIEMVCRYRTVGDQGGWLLLEAGPDRCGDPTTSATVRAPFGEPIAIPPATGTDLVVGRIDGINQSLLDRLRTTAFKSQTFLVTGDDGVGHRFVPDTQSQWHVLRAPACATRVLDGHAWVTDSMTFSTATDPQPGGEVTVELASVPFSC